MNTNRRLTLEQKRVIVALATFHLLHEDDFDQDIEFGLCLSVEAMARLWDRGIVAVFTAGDRFDVVMTEKGFQLFESLVKRVSQ